MHIMQVLKNTAYDIIRDCKNDNLNEATILEHLIILCDILDIDPDDHIE